MASIATHNVILKIGVSMHSDGYVCMCLAIFVLFDIRPPPYWKRTYSASFVQKCILLSNMEQNTVKFNILQMCIIIVPLGIKKLHYKTPSCAVFAWYPLFTAHLLLAQTNENII